MNTQSRNQPYRIPAMLLAGSAMLSMGLSGCSDDPEAEYQDAVEELQDAKQEHRDAREDQQEVSADLSEHEQELRELRAELAAARKEAAEARRQMEQREAIVAERASDSVLFRALQRKLVDDDEFEHGVIQVQVNNRAVRLDGWVASAETREKAGKVAREQPGVVSVANNLRVEEPGAEHASQPKARAVVIPAKPVATPTASPKPSPVATPTPMPKATATPAPTSKPTASPAKVSLRNAGISPAPIASSKTAATASNGSNIAANNPAATLLKAAPANCQPFVQAALDMRDS